MNWIHTAFSEFQTEAEDIWIGLAYACILVESGGHVWLSSYRVPRNAGGAGGGGGQVPGIS